MHKGDAKKLSSRLEQLSIPLLCYSLFSQQKLTFYLCGRKSLRAPFLNLERRPSFAAQKLHAYAKFHVCEVGPSPNPPASSPRQAANCWVFVPVLVLKSRAGPSRIKKHTWTERTMRSTLSAIARFLETLSTSVTATFAKRMR